MSSKAELVPVHEEKLVVRDLFGRTRAYSLADVKARFVPKGVPDQDVMIFSMLCNMTGANPFTREAYILPFKEKDGAVRGASFISLNYYRRRASKSGTFDGLVKFVCDKDEKALPKTADTAQIMGGVCEVHIKGRRFPVREVVTLAEARKETPFWTDKAKAVHQLLVRAEYRALSIAFPVGVPAAFGEVPGEVVEAHWETQAELQEAAEAQTTGNGDATPVVPEPSAEPPASAADHEAIKAAIGGDKDLGRAYREQCTQWGTTPAKLPVTRVEAALDWIYGARLAAEAPVATPAEPVELAAPANDEGLV